MDSDYEFDSGRGISLKHIALDGQRVMTIATGSGVTHEYHFHADQVGTNRVVTDENGAVVQRSFSDPFGSVYAVVNDANSIIAPSSWSSPYIFTGQHADTESNLDYFGGRYYDPVVGRFLSVDSQLIGARSGITFNGMAVSGLYSDPYSYSLNRPTNAVDVEGEWVVLVTAGLGGAFAFAEEYHRVGGELGEVNLGVVAAGLAAGATTGGASNIAEFFGLTAAVGTTGGSAIVGATTAAVQQGVDSKLRGETLTTAHIVGMAALGGLAGAAGGGWEGVVKPQLAKQLPELGQWSLQALSIDLPFETYNIGAGSVLDKVSPSARVGAGCTLCTGNGLLSAAQGSLAAFEQGLNSWAVPLSFLSSSGAGMGGPGLGQDDGGASPPHTLMLEINADP